MICYFCLKEWKLKTLTRLLLIHIKNLKQALNHGLVLKKVNKVIKFNQEAWLKSYDDTNTELRKKAKNDFDKDFFKFISNSVFGKAM